MCPFIDLLILTNMKELLVMYLSNSLANIQFFPAEKWDDLCSLHSWSFKVRPADCWLQRFPHPAEAAVTSKWIDRHVRHIFIFHLFIFCCSCFVINDSISKVIPFIPSYSIDASAQAFYPRLFNRPECVYTALLILTLII